MQRFPVFIVGSPRSGTSILVDALLAAGYHGFREGSFISVVGRMNYVIDQQFRDYAGDPETMITQIDPVKFKHDVWLLIKRAVERVNPVAPWFDKTGNPEMMSSAEAVLHLWPDAVFVFCKRRAIENVYSRLRKFPTRDFDYHCRNWAQNMATWRYVRTRLPAEKFIEIDQQEMVQYPGDVSVKLERFLGLSPEAALKVAHEFSSSRPQQTEIGSAARVMSLDAVDWPDGWKLAFGNLCGEEMEAFGYSVDDKYWLGGKQTL